MAKMDALGFPRQNDVVLYLPDVGADPATLAPPAGLLTLLIVDVPLPFPPELLEAAIRIRPTAPPRRRPSTAIVTDWPDKTAVPDPTYMHKRARIIDHAGR